MSKKQIYLAGYFMVFIISALVRVGSSASFFFADYDSTHRNFEIYDSNYQARRTEQVLKNYPSVSFQDSYHYYPENPRVPWPTGYNLFLASLVKPIDSIFKDQLLTETVEGFVPCLLDSLTAVLFLWLFSQFVSFHIAWVAALLYALSFVNSQYSELGNIDHHYFITFMNATFSILMLKFSRAMTIRSALILGIALGSAGFFNVSSIQYVLLYLLCLLGWVLGSNSQSRLGVLSGWVYLSCFLTSVLSGLSTPAGRSLLLRYDETSLFQPALILIASMGAGLVLVWKGKVALVRNLKWIYTFCFCSVIFFAFFPIFKNLYEGGKFLLLGNILNGSQSEEASILNYYPNIFYAYTWGIFLVPFGILNIFKNRKNFPLLTVLLTVFFSYGVACSVAHFGYIQFFYPWYALVVAVGLFAFVQSIADDLFFRTFLVVCFFLQPIFVTGSLSLNLSGIKDGVRSAMEQTIHAFTWIHEHTPATSFYDFGEGIPEYSVLARRDYGHLIVRYGHRPVIVSPFSTPDFMGHMQDYARYVFSESEQEVVAIMEQYRARYLVVDNVDNPRFYFNILKKTRPPDFDKYKPRGHAEKMPGMFKNKLLYFDGQAIDGLPMGPENTATQHFRLIYEVPEKLDFQIRLNGEVRSFRFNGLKTFEKVQGARILGKSAPGVKVEFELALKSNVDRQFFYRQSTIADSNGNYSFTIPYSTSTAEPAGGTSVFSIQPWGEIRWNKSKIRISIPEITVQRGEVIRLP